MKKIKEFVATGTIITTIISFTFVIGLDFTDFIYFQEIIDDSNIFVNHPCELVFILSFIEIKDLRGIENIKFLTNLRKFERLQEHGSDWDKQSVGIQENDGLNSLGDQVDAAPDQSLVNPKLDPESGILIVIFPLQQKANDYC